MHVLVVISHPNPRSFTHALVERFCDGARDAGHTVEIADLHAEGFDPRWSVADLSQFEGGPLPSDVLAEQARIERCGALCMAFPLFWFAMPAMLKGWVDRVWTYGWAYDQVGDPHRSLLRDRVGVMLVPAGGNPENWRPHKLEEAMHVLWETGTMGYFGLTDKRIHILPGSEGSLARREGLLRRAFDAGATLANPTAAANTAL